MNRTELALVVWTVPSGTETAVFERSLTAAIGPVPMYRDRLASFYGPHHAHHAVLFAAAYQAEKEKA